MKLKDVQSNEIHDILIDIYGRYEDFDKLSVYIETVLLNQGLKILSQKITKLKEKIGKNPDDKGDYLKGYNCGYSNALRTVETLIADLEAKQISKTFI